MVAGGALRIDHAGNLLRLAGDMDEATHAGLAAALDRFAGEPGDIHIDLSGVDFCDVASLRALVLLSHASRQYPDQPGRRVILHQPPAELKNLLQILGWDATPGLVVNESLARLSSWPEVLQQPQESKCSAAGDCDFTAQSR